MIKRRRTGRVFFATVRRSRLCRWFFAALFAFLFSIVYLTRAAWFGSLVRRHLDNDPAGIRSR
jgi:hypothetical protein